MDTNLHPSPAVIIADLFSYRRTAALKAAIELDVFTAIADGARSAEAIAFARGASARGCRILCDFLVACGHLDKDGDHYSLTRNSAIFLDRHSSAFMGGIVNFVASTETVQGLLDDPAAYVKRGGTSAPAGGLLEPDHPRWVEFAHHMAPMMAVPAESLANLIARSDAERLDVLDVAAGHGQWGIAVARRNPRAMLTALDWPAVLDVAEANATAAGLRNRFIRLAGDAFTVELGRDRDLVLVPNFLHHFPPATCIGFLERIRSALAPGGRVAIVDFMPDDSRVSSPFAAGMALTMLAMTESGDIYTGNEIRVMLDAAGFSATEIHNLAATPMSAAIAKATH